MGTEKRATVWTAAVDNDGQKNVVDPDSENMVCDDEKVPKEALLHIPKEATEESSLLPKNREDIRTDDFCLN